jgi:hypothetical protein
MRPLLYLSLAAALQVPTALYAQQVTVAGWLDRIDAANGTLTLRTFGNPRTIQVAPNATVRINGAAARIEQLPLDSQISVIAEKGPDGMLHAVQISARGTIGSPTAGSPAGSVISGRLVGLNLPMNQITVRTSTGDFAVPLGTAPIIINGAGGSTRGLRLGQTVRIERALPTEGSTEYVTQAVHVTAAPVTGAARAVGAAATGAGIVDRGTPIAGSRSGAVVRSSTRGYRRSITRSRSARARHRSRRANRRARYANHSRWIQGG